MRPRTIEDYIDEEIQFANDVEKVFAGKFSDEASHEIIVRLTAAKQAAEGYRENEMNAFLAKVYFNLGLRLVRVGHQQSALDNFLQAQAVLPIEIDIDGKMVGTEQEMKEVKSYIQACLAALKGDKLQAFTDQPPGNVKKPVTKLLRPQTALPPESTLKNNGGFAKSPNSAFHSPRLEESPSSALNDEEKKTQFPRKGPK